MNVISYVMISRLFVVFRLFVNENIFYHSAFLIQIHGCFSLYLYPPGYLVTKYVLED